MKCELDFQFAVHASLNAVKSLKYQIQIAKIEISLSHHIFKKDIITQLNFNCLNIINNLIVIADNFYYNKFLNYYDQNAVNEMLQVIMKLA